MFENRTRCFKTALEKQVPKRCSLDKPARIDKFASGRAETSTPFGRILELMRIPSKRLLAWPAVSGLLLVAVIATPAPRALAASTHMGDSSEDKRLNVPTELSQSVKAEGQLGPGKGTVFIGLEPPTGAKLTAGSPVVIEASGEGLKFPSKLKTQMEPGNPVALPVEVDESSPGKAQIKLSYYWCHNGDSGQCVREHAELAVSLDLTGDSAGGEAYFSYRASAK